MKLFFFNKFKAFFYENINSIVNAQIRDKEKQKKQDDFNSKVTIFESQYPINDLFFCITNEWESLTIGKIIGYEFFGRNNSKPLPVIEDVLTKKTFITFAILIPYSENMLHTLKLLNPYQRYALASNTVDILDGKPISDNLNNHFGNEKSALEYLKHIK